MRGFRHGRRLPAYCLLVLLQLSLAGCDRPPPEQALRDAVAELETALEAGDVDTLLDRLDDGFRYRDLDRKAVGRRLVGAFLRYPKRQVTFMNVRVDLATPADRAAVRFNALVWGGRAALPDDADGFQVSSHWRRDGGDWLLTEVETRGWRR